MSICLNSKFPIALYWGAEYNGAGARIDTDRFEQVISNLLENAVTHGDKTQPVQVVIASQPNTVSVAVHNHGEAIDAAFLPHLFNPFAQGESSRGHSAGLGLGLYISERIIHAHHGKFRCNPRERQALDSKRSCLDSPMTISR